jgi:hypothetical protein|nr:MAG TPA: hypothetical protein [Caudoviricetes sp.]
MKQYIGTKLIEAEKAYRVDGKVVTLAENRVPCGNEVERGYKVRYADGYESFSPAEVFERAYLPLEVNGMLKTAAPSISAEMVERFIDHHETVTMGGKTTVVRAVLKNGFEIVESSSCVSAENYDEKLGEEICMERIRNKIWELLGFLLQTAVGGVNGEAAAENCCCDEDCERSCCDEEPAADEPAVPKLPTVRLFISQPMRGKSDEEIESEREDLIAIAKAVYAGRGEVEVIDSFFKGGLDVPAGAKAPLYYLSKSLELLATADVAIFAEDWREARGCRIEHECADGYGVARIELPEEG